MTPTLPHDGDEEGLPGGDISTPIGNFILTFSAIEYLMVMNAAKLISPGNFYPVIFACKRLPADAKREILLRAVKQHLPGPEGEELRAVLRDTQTAIERRNEIVHGTFLRTTTGMRLGRMGGLDPGADMDEISSATLEADQAQLEDIYRRLIGALTNVRAPPAGDRG